MPRLHHVAVIRNDLAAMTEEADSLGLPIVFRSDMSDLSCIYADARGQCGHFLEFVYATPAGLPIDRLAGHRRRLIARPASGMPRRRPAVGVLSGSCR